MSLVEEAGPEYEWLFRNMHVLREIYGSHTYIAVEGEEIAGVGTAAEAVAEAKKAGFGNFMLIMIPSEEEQDRELSR